LRTLTGLALSLVLAAPVGAAERMKVILDTDIGTDIDDAWALGFALAHPGFDLRGVTVTDGDTVSRARVACKLLHVAGRGDVPVAVGRATKVPADRLDLQFSWAEDFQARRAVGTPAARFLVDAARKHPGEITLIAVGPLQNVADALRLEPGLGRYLKRVVLMSGCIRGTADRPDKIIPEWNVVSATADAQLVYAAKLPLTIVPLDSTTHVRLSDPERDRLRNHHSPLTVSLEALYRLWIETPAQRMTLHDQLAVAEAADPGAFFARVEEMSLIVDGEGYTRIDPARGGKVSVCLEPRRDVLMKAYLDGLMSWPPPRPGAPPKPAAAQPPGS
jgi:inosine-uridine nucleoside N-ribohydrolase